jgi:hypothetical protein
LGSGGAPESFAGIVSSRPGRVSRSGSSDVPAIAFDVAINETQTRVLVCEHAAWLR